MDFLQPFFCGLKLIEYFGAKPIIYQFCNWKYETTTKITDTNN
jgi:hypothetical protein